MKMWKILYFVTVVGVFLQTVNGEQWDIKKMEKCACANDVIEGFLASVAKNEAESFNGQKLSLRLWQSTNDKCTAHVLDKSPKAGEIEINMLFHASVHIEEQDEGEVQQQRFVEIEQEQAGGDIGQQRGVDIGQDQAAENTEPQEVDYAQGQTDQNIELQQEEDIGQGQTAQYTEPQQEDIGQGQTDQYAEPQQEDIGQGQTDQYAEPQQEDIGQGQTDQYAEPKQEEDIGQAQTGQYTEPKQEEDIGQAQVAAVLLDNLVIEQMKQSMATGQLQQNPNLGQEEEGVDVGQEQPNQSNDSHLQTGGDKKNYKTQFSFSLDVATGKLSDTTNSLTGTQRRKREIMPFDTVNIEMEINFEQPASDDGTANDQIRPLLKKGLADYWLKMTNCLLDVKE